ncbi:YidC/Oxa1 family membrane protein insertase [Candidatus Margulisiibacteriota bacterium]
MLSVLQFLFNLSGNYGTAVVLLTIIIKFALYPLTLQSTRQMDAMQKIQPKVQELQKKFKDKPDQLQKETVALYKQEGVNPLGGCLPMLLQIPFFIGLFVALTSKEFAALLSAEGVSANFLWIGNLAKPDPTYVMVALIGISTYLSQITMPGAGSKQQKGMLYFMPAFIAFISMKFPAGVQLYWTVSNLLTVAQQLYISRVKK